MSRARAPRTRDAETTRADLVRAGRELFVARGYAAASVGMLARRARVTTGALYHHFGGKEGLFRAVAEAITGDLVSGAGSAVSSERDPWRQLGRGVQAILDASGTPEVRLAFLEAPVVLGLAAWRELETRHTAPLLGAAFEGLVRSGQLSAAQAAQAARLVRGAVVEAAMAVAEAEDPRATGRELGRMLAAMIDGLRR